MAKYWYQIEVFTGVGDPIWYVGSTEKDLEALNGLLSEGRAISLGDLVYFNEEDRAMSWSEWDPLYMSQICVNARYVVSIMPLAEDPRKSSREDGVLLRLPSSRR